MTGNINRGLFLPRNLQASLYITPAAQRRKSLTINTPAFWALPKGIPPYQNDHRLQSSDKLASSDPDPWNIQVCWLMYRLRIKPMLNQIYKLWQDPAPWLLYREGTYPGDILDTILTKIQTAYSRVHQWPETHVNLLTGSTVLSIHCRTSPYRGD